MVKVSQTSPRVVFAEKKTITNPEQSMNIYSDFFSIQDNF